MAVLLVIVDAHTGPADAAQDPPLQQGRPLAGGTLPTLAAETPGVGGQALLVGLELLLGNVSGMLVGQDDRPLLARYGASEVGAIGTSASAASAIDEDPGIARIVQDLEQ